MLDLADGGATISLTPNGEDVRSEISGWLGSIASEKMRQAAQGRFGVLIAEITAESEATLAQPWLKATRTPWDATRDDPGLADALRSLGCVAIEAPHVARGLLRRIDLEDRARPYVPRLAAHLLSPDCKGAKGLTDEERSRLQDLAGQGVDPPGRQQK